MIRLRVLGLLLVGGIAGCGGSSEETAVGGTTKLPEPRAASPTRRTSGIEAACVAKPGSVLKIKSQVSGEVSKVFVNVGDAVKPGQPLIEIALRDVQLQLTRVDISEQRAQTRLETQRLQLSRAEREAEAIKELYSDVRLAKETTAMNVQRLQVGELELELKDLSLQRAELLRQLGNARISATTSGTILQRNVEPGQVIGAAIGVASGGDVLLEIGDLSRMTMECAVHQSDASRITVGSQLYFEVGGRGAVPFEAKISRISPTIEMAGGVSQLKFFAQLDSDVTDRFKILPGMRLTGISQPTKQRLADD